MIRYTLACDAGHEFESWFPSAASYDAQAAGGLVECPACGSKAVGKTLMAPAVARTDRGRRIAGPDGGRIEAGRIDAGRIDAGRIEAGRDEAARGRDGADPGTEAQAPPAADASSEGAVPMIAEPERRLRALLRAVREHVTRTADDVGARFPDEARAMHYGEVPVRAIYGEASIGEARALIEEGIEVAPLPPAPEDRH